LLARRSKKEKDPRVKKKGEKDDPNALVLSTLLRKLILVLLEDGDRLERKLVIGGNLAVDQKGGGRAGTFRTQSNE
jgi:hypothetical protein